MYIRKPGYTTITAASVKSVAVVMVMWMVMMVIGGAAAVPSSHSHEPDLRGLWERVTSHTETLRNINWYLKQTDNFWKWFQENKG